MLTIADSDKAAVRITVFFGEQIGCRRWINEIEQLTDQFLAKPGRKVYVEAHGTGGRMAPVDCSGSGWLHRVMLFNRPPEREIPEEVGGGDLALCEVCHDEGGAWSLTVATRPQVLMRGPDGYSFANWIRIRLYESPRPEVEDYLAADEILRAVCSRWKPVFAHVCHGMEYRAKNKNRFENSIGEAFDRALPGIYWGTYFGSLYSGFIGRNKLLSVPIVRAEPLGEGVVVYLSENAYVWKTRRYRQRERRVRKHLGPEYFFDRKHPKRKTVGPDFGVPPVRPMVPLVRRALTTEPVPRSLQDTEMLGVLSVVTGLASLVTAYAVLPPSEVGPVLWGVLAFAPLGLALAGMLKSLLIRETSSTAPKIGLVVAVALLVVWHMLR